MKVNLDTNADDVQIQLIPLIDVIFCILTFFILAALQLTRQQAINIDLPKASTGVTQMRDMLVVTINSTGQTYVDRQYVDRNQLAQTLQAYRQKAPNGLLVLYASQTAFYNDVVQVLDLMRQVGGDRVALATLPANPNATPSPTVLPPTISPVNPFDSLNPTPQPTLPQSPIIPGQPPFTPGAGQIPNTGVPGIAPSPRTTPRF
jgi:biopolymer transport protein ExbD